MTNHSDLSQGPAVDRCDGILDGGEDCEERASYATATGAALCEDCYHAGDDKSEGSIFGEEES